MVLDTKQTTVAFRCPHCGTGVMSAVNLFTLKGSMIRLKCECGKSAMEIIPATDGRIHLTVPCVICPKPHRFTINESVFFGKDLFTIPCPYSDINVCTIGEINHVKAELSRSELELLDLMEKSGIDSFSVLHEDAERTLPDPQVLEIVLFVIRDLDDEGKIECLCEKDTPHEYDVEITEDGVCVTCRSCGATKILPTDSLLDAHDFLNCDSLKLEPPRGN